MKQEQEGVEEVEGVEEGIRPIVRDGADATADQAKLIDSVIGCAISVHSALGAGYLEQIYEAALAIELETQGIPFEQQRSFQLRYRGRAIGEGRLDLLIDDQLVVELKAVERLAPIHTAQVISYLQALDLRVGLIINFNVSSLRKGLKRVTHPDLYHA